MPFILTDAGEALEANNLLNGTTSGIDQITLGEGNRIPDGTEVALVQPFNPVRELADPRGAVAGNQGSVDWEEEGNAAAYVVKEAGLWVGNVLVGYDSNAAGNIFAKTTNQRIVHRFLWVASSGALATFTFTNIQNSGPATETAAGIAEIASNSEANASEANASNTVIVTPSKWWRMFTGARIVARLTALTDANRLSYNALKDKPAPGVVPQASQNVAGVAEIASNSEADANEGGSSNTVIVTPSKWWRMFTGARIVARLTALTDANRLSYNALKDKPAPGVVPQASQNVAGVAEIASNSEADANEGGSSNTVIVTPSKWWRMFTGARIVARLTALNGTARLSYNALQNVPSAVDLSNYAQLSSPIFTGNPQVPDQSAATNNNRVANTQFVQGRIAALNGSAIADLIDVFLGTGWRQAPGTPVTYTAAEIRDLYESNANRNAFTNALLAALNAAAPLSNPVFTGDPEVPDQVGTSNNNRIANTQFVQSRITALVASAPGTLNTLNELAAAMGDDPNFATTIMDMLGLKAPLASPVFTGNPRVPTRASTDNDTSAASTAFVVAAIANLVASAPGTLNTLNELAAALGDDPNFATTLMGLLGDKAPIANPVLTGNPRSVTRGGSDDDTSIATTAFTQDAIDRRTLVVTADPTQANIDAIPDGGMILVRDTTAYTP